MKDPLDFPDQVNELVKEINKLHKTLKDKNQLREPLSSDELEVIGKFFPHDDLVLIIITAFRKKVEAYKVSSPNSKYPYEQLLQKEVMAFRKIIKLCDEVYVRCKKSDIWKLKLAYTYFPAILHTYMHLLDGLTGVKGYIRSPVLAMFCMCVNQSSLIPQRESESAETYCIKICDFFGFAYSDRVRQNYGYKAEKKYISKITTQILPRLDNHSYTVIENYLNKEDNIFYKK